MALVNDKLRKLKESHNLGNKQVFTLIGYEDVDKADMSEYFNGTKGRNLQPHILEAFAIYFNVDLEDYLLNDECPIIDNPQEKYPYISKEEKERKQNDFLEDLKSKVSNYKEIDEEFKKDTINLIGKLTTISKGYDNIFQTYESTIKSSTLDGIKDVGKYCNKQYYNIMFKKIFNTLSLIIDYFNNNKAVSFYQATTALYSIKHDLENLNEHLNLLNDINNRMIKIANYAEKITSLGDSSVTLVSNLIESLDVCANPKVNEVIEKCPVEDATSLVNFYILTLQNQVLNITFDKTDDNDIINKEILYNKLNNYRLSLVYDEEIGFLLESAPNTLEKLYRFLIECYNDELVIKFIDKEYQRLEKEYKEWIEFAVSYLKQ